MNIVSNVNYFFGTIMVWSVCIFCLLANPVDADLVQSAVAVEGPSAIESFLWERTIDQSGLNLEFESGVTDYDSYINSNPTPC